MENTAVLRDLWNLFADNKVGSGMSREVYTSQLLPGSVVKVEVGAGFFQNVLEWETWCSVRGTEYEKWFAPCEFIGANGTILVMKRTIPARDKEYPAQMPAFLSDLKRTNYGILEGRLVCHDYGTNLLMEHGKTTRMCKAHWFDK